MKDNLALNITETFFKLEDLKGVLLDGDRLAGVTQGTALSDDEVNALTVAFQHEWGVLEERLRLDLGALVQLLAQKQQP